MITPSNLQTGDTIGLITPSSPMQSGRLECAIQYFENKGFKVKAGKHVHESDRFLAGSDKDRADDINRFFLDPSFKAIIATGGGYGSQRILPFLDMKIIQENPKWLVGFSDTTALQIGILSQTNLVSCTGFSCRDLDNLVVDEQVESTLMNCLTGKPYSIHEGVMIHPGHVKGKLIGGNLECLSALIGTPYQPNFKDCILMIEEVWSEPYKIDSKISQLQLAGIFNEIAGLIWGKFESCDPQHFPDRDGNVDDIIHDWSNRISVPSIKNFPYGHQSSRCILPIGKEVTLDANHVSVSVEYH